MPATHSCWDALMPVPGKNKMWSARTRSHRPQFPCFATKQLKITTYTRFNTPFVRFCGFWMLLKNAFTGRKFITAFFSQLVLCHLFRPMHLPLAQCHFTLYTGKTRMIEMWRIRSKVVSTTEASRCSKYRNQKLFEWIVHVVRMWRELCLWQTSKANFNYSIFFLILFVMPFGDFVAPFRSWALNLYWLVPVAGATCLQNRQMTTMMAGVAKQTEQARTSHTWFILMGFTAINKSIFHILRCRPRHTHTRLPGVFIKRTSCY